MSRPLRIEYRGAWYHVMNRGLDRALTYTKPEDYSIFLDTLGEACSLFHVGVSAYCLMPNHYHLLIHTPEGNLSRFMRHLNGVYTQRFNRRRHRDGPLFRGRFKGMLVQEDSYLLQVVQYIHQNPVKARMVDSLNDFKWSSHRYFMKSKERPEWLKADCILRQFSGRRAKAVSLYKDFMGREMNEEVSGFYAKKYWRPILGDESFTEWAKEKLLAEEWGSDSEIRDKRVMLGGRQVQRINAAVRRYYKVSGKRLQFSRRGEENIPRKMAICLARELSGLTLSELAQAYGGNSYRPIATGCYRFKRLMAKDKKLSRIYERLKTECSHVKI